MTDHFLIIDTESSGLPKNWESPYEKDTDWPHILQISWVICNADGQTIKEEDHYLKNSGFIIEDSSRNIHGISDEILAEKGMDIKQVLTILEKDLDVYQPLIIGHFIELDYRLLGAEYFRLNRVFPLKKFTFFCTMKGARLLPETGLQRSWKLTDLYWYFFQEAQPFPHNALYDAKATADCFFKEKEILPVGSEYFYQQRPIIPQPDYRQKTKKIGMMLAALLVVFIVIVLIFLFK